MSPKNNTSKTGLSSIASWIIILAGVFALLNYFENFFKPLVVSLIIWYLIRELTRQIGRIEIRKKRIPYWLRSILSFLIITGFLYSAAQIFIFNFDKLMNNFPEYSRTVTEMVNQVEGFLGIGKISEQFTFQSLDIQEIVSSSIASITSFFSQFALILLYVIFLMAEERVITRKIRNFGQDSAHGSKFIDILGRINKSVHSYITVKFFTSFLTGTLSYGMLIILNVDLAGLWAFLIFLLNFIPNIGSITATLFPALFAFLQYNSFYNFLYVLLSVGVIQLLVGNFLEPRVMGSRLNLSPFVVLLSLFFWGYIWGIIGMLLSVPITVSIMLIAGYFPETRPFALLLSQNGKISIEDEIKEQSK